jgi:hypothetical protein
MTDLTNRNTFGQVNAGISGFRMLDPPPPPPKDIYVSFIYHYTVTVLLAVTLLLYPQEPRPQFSL